MIGNLEENKNPFVSLPIVGNKSFKDLKVGFFIDTSGSTGEVFIEGTNVLGIEKNIVELIAAQLSLPPVLISWDHGANVVDNSSQLYSGGGTEPSCIFKNVDTLNIVLGLDVAIIITDGQINVDHINEFGRYMAQHASHLKGIIGIIVGKRHCKMTRSMRKPCEINASVLIPAMLSNGCILFHNSTDTYIMWASGTFRTVWNPINIDNDIDWPAVTLANLQTISNIMLPTHDESLQIALHNRGYIPFGGGLYFNPEYLLSSNISLNEFLNLPFDRVCQYFRVSQQYEKLIQWAKAQKDRYLQEFVPDPEEKANIDNLFNQMGQPRPARSHNQDYVRSFVRNRNRTLAWRYVEDEEIEDLVDDPNIVRLLQFFRNMMQIMEEDNRLQYTASAYTTSSISTSRYTLSSSTRNRQDNQTYSTLNCTSISALFSEPYKWYRQFQRLYPDHKSIQSECTICCEKCVPFILVRKHIDKNNMNDLLDNPLTYFYPEILCSKCVDYFCMQGIDPVRVPCYAAIPIINILDNYRQIYYMCFSRMTNFIDYDNNTSGLVSNSNASQLACLKFVMTIFAGLLKQHFEKSGLNELFENFEKEVRA